MKVLVINGPNLNMLGKREPEVYGAASLEDILTELGNCAQQLKVELSHVQSNAEHELIDAIHAAFGNTDAIIINPAAFTHTSVAIRDALLSVSIPYYEVHLSNVHSREAFRHHSYLADKAVGVISGCGPLGYQFALNAAKSAWDREQD